MATKARLASLVVDLQVQSAELRKGLDEANRKLDSFAKQAESAGNILAGAFAFDQLKDGATWLAGFVKSGADATVAMGNMAKAAGTPVEEFSKLAYAAESFGYESDNLAESFAQLAEYMGEAKKGSAEHVALFKALDISVTDASGNLRSTGDVFRDLAQRFSETADGSAKTALAVKFFGEEGIKLIPTLNLGRDGLARFGEEAERTGKVVTEEGAAGAARFNKAIQALEGAAQGLAAGVAQDLAPSLAALAEELATSSTRANGSNGAFSVLTTTLRLLSSVGVAVATSFDVIGKAAAGAAAWTVALFDDDAMSSASGEAGAAAGKAIIASLEEEGRLFRAIWSKDGPGATMAKDAEKAKPSADAMVDAIERQKKAAEKAAEAQKRLAAETKKAMEAATKAMDERASAALSLERTQLGIERAADKRRAGASGESPTQGFASFDGALKTWADALKREAALRDRASFEGDPLKADDLLRAADAQGVLADRASEAADAFKAATDTIRASIRLVSEETTRMALAGRREMEEAIQRVAGVTTQMALNAGQRQADAAAQRNAAGGELAGMLAPSGGATSAMLQGAQTGAAAGPFGAAAGALTGLLSQSETFQGALGRLEAIFQALANSVGTLVEPLLPLLTVVGEVAGVFGLLVEAISPLVEFVARPLYEVFKGLALVVMGIIKFVGNIINFIAKAFGGKGLNLKGVDEAMRRLESTSYDSAKAQEKLALETREASDGIENVPSWWMVESARFNATRPEGGGAGGGGGGTVVNDSSTVNIVIPGTTDPKTVAKEIREALDKKGVRGKGSRFDTEEMP